MSRVVVSGLVALIFMTSAVNLCAQQSDVYSFNWKQDRYFYGGTVFLWGIGSINRANFEAPSEETILALDPSDVLRVDRGAIDNFSKSADKWSDYLLWGAAATPFLLYVDRRARSEKWDIALMALEGFFLADGVLNISKTMVKRFRPLAYNPDVPIEEKLNAAIQYSFPSGHTSTVAYATFFSAQVYTDMYPESKWKPVIWTTAIVLPALTGYLRYEAGKHFPIDVISGYAMGAGIGLLIPYLHKNVLDEDLSLAILPSGFSLQYTF